jgi:hypothetical protein
VEEAKWIVKVPIGSLNFFLQKWGIPVGASLFSACQMQQRVPWFLDLARMEKPGPLINEITEISSPQIPAYPP